MSDRVLQRLRANPKVEDAFLLSGDGDHEYSILLKPEYRDYSDPYNPSRIIVATYAKDAEQAIREAVSVNQKGPSA